MSYTALVLDLESHEKLVKYFQPPVVALDWTRICHHMTINLGPAQNGPAADLVGQKFEMIATTFAEDNLAIAVGVETKVPSNKFKHITVAVNVNEGGKPKHSNNLSNWMPLQQPIVLHGTVQVL